MRGCITPEMVGAKRDPKAPAVIFVHGAGYLQNAHKFWSSYYREYMFHHLLASRGYVVLDPDYRASAGYGRDWRTAIYRWMGGHDLNDVVDGAAYLAKAAEGECEADWRLWRQLRRLHHADGALHLARYVRRRRGAAAGDRLGALQPSATPRTSSTSRRRMPRPTARARRSTSPKGLKAPLLIAHGMVDVNVHFQDSVRLAQRLIELRKENWELAVYPVEDHGFVEAASWADEYKRILKLFETNLKK